MLKEIKVKNVLFNILGSAILAFGYYNVHSISNITEGGLLGLTLLLKYIIGISPALTSVVLTIICYLIGYKTFGKSFIIYSAFASISYSIFYFVFEQFPPIYPAIANYPLIACIVGAIFVGVGVGLCVRYGGAPNGDDALAMSICVKWKIKIQFIYLFFDIFILLVSLVYISYTVILYSLLTVFLSGQIIGWITKNRVESYVK